MLNLDTTSSKIQVVTGAAVAALVVHASYLDLTNATGAITADALNTSISTAATVDVVAAPGAGICRNVKMLVARNTNATSSNTITIQHTDGTTVVALWSGTLSPGMSVVVNEVGLVQVFAASGVPLAPLSSGAISNQSTATVSAAYATDTYLVGSSILIPAQRPRVGTRFRVLFDMTKTAAGTATPIVTLRYGTNATTADTGIATFTFGAGTAAAATGTFVLEGVFRTVGTGTSAIIQANCSLRDLATTGLSSTLKSVSTTSSGFDSTTANTFLGVSFNGGTAFVGSNTVVLADLSNI